MAFKFNFTQDNEPIDNEICEEAKSLTDSTSCTLEKPFSQVSSLLLKDVNEFNPEAYPLDSVTLYYVSQKYAEEELTQSLDSDLTNVFTKGSDLVPNVYEGGLKIWECSLDLIEYFENEQISFKGAVLELGCGAGLPAIYAMYKGATKVHFSDYNDEVLKHITVPNVHLNCVEDPQLSINNCEFFAGDWSCLQKELLGRGEMYDCILTSETIYSPESYRKLHDIMNTLLKPDGTIYLSAKVYYFGVGGGLREFEKLIDLMGVFEYKTCKVLSEGVNREILKLTKKVGPT